MKRNTKLVGDLSELAVMSALIRAGYEVAVPWGDNCRYDLVGDKDGVLSRIQVKTGRLEHGAIQFNCYSTHAHRGGKLRSYKGEIDFFGVYCPQVKAVFLIPVDDVGGSSNLRWEPPRNGQQKKIRWASSYLLSHVAVASVGTIVEDVVPFTATPLGLPL
jgi:hypothetical protein